MENSTAFDQPGRKDVLAQAAPFAITGLLWLILGLGLGFTQERAPGLFAWIAGLWALCMLDLVALAKAIAATLSATSAAADKRSPAVMQALYWGGIKVACLGLFVGVLLKGESIPGLSLLIGFGTLVVVPLVGGFFWSQRALHHA